MMGSGIFALSWHKENVLRLIGHGMTRPKYFRSADVAALSKLALIEERQGAITLTEQGEQLLARQRKLLFQSIVVTARDQSQ